MYLTKVMMSLQNRKTANILGNCQEMHRFLCQMFDADRKAKNVLYRISVKRSSVQIYLYSDTPPVNIPENVALEGQRNLSDWMNAMVNGDIFGFDITVLPTKKICHPEGKKNSQRRVLRKPQERLQWLQRKANQNGFELVIVEELEQNQVYGHHPQGKGGAMYLNAFHYQGTLRITDEYKFRKAVAEGIGPGKAYGMGMLLLKKL